MRSVHELTDAELREELERTREDFARYVEDVGTYPTHASRDLDDGARRHLDVREELDRRAGGHHDDLPAAAGSDPDAGGQAGGGHVDVGEQQAAREASYAGDPDRGTGQDSDQTAAAPERAPAPEGSTKPDVPGPAPEDDRRSEAQEDLSDKLDPGDIEPYA